MWSQQYKCMHDGSKWKRWFDHSWVVMSKGFTDRWWSNTSCHILPSELLVVLKESTGRHSTQRTVLQQQAQSLSWSWSSDSNLTFLHLRRFRLKYICGSDPHSGEHPGLRLIRCDAFDVMKSSIVQGVCVCVCGGGYFCTSYELSYHVVLWHSLNSPVCLPRCFWTISSCSNVRIPPWTFLGFYTSNKHAL